MVWPGTLSFLTALGLDTGGRKPSANVGHQGLLFSMLPASLQSPHVHLPFLPPDNPFYSPSLLDSYVVAVENSEMVTMIPNTTVTPGILLVGAGALETFLDSKEISGPALVFTGLEKHQGLAEGSNKRPTGLIRSLRYFLFNQLSVFVLNLNAFRLMHLSRDHSVLLAPTGHLAMFGDVSGCQNWCRRAAPVAQRFSAACSPGCVLGTQYQVPYQAPCREPASPLVCASASLCVSLMSK